MSTSFGITHLQEIRLLAPLEILAPIVQRLRRRPPAHDEVARRHSAMLTQYVASGLSRRTAYDAWTEDLCRSGSLEPGPVRLWLERAVADASTTSARIGIQPEFGEECASVLRRMIPDPFADGFNFSSFVGMPEDIEHLGGDLPQFWAERRYGMALRRTHCSASALERTELKDTRGRTLIVAPYVIRSPGPIHPLLMTDLLSSMPGVGICSARSTLMRDGAVDRAEVVALRREGYARREVSFVPIPVGHDPAATLADLTASIGSARDQCWTEASSGARPPVLPVEIHPLTEEAAFLAP
jgi:hypothetical protein